MVWPWGGLALVVGPYKRGGGYFIIFYNPGGVSVGVVGLWGRIRGENVGMEVLI